MQITKLITNGLRKTLKLTNGAQFSYGGQWVNVVEPIAIDTWYVQDFASADYTISVDNGADSKEIIKCLVAAGPSNAALTIYGRVDTGSNIITLTASVDNSKFTLYATPVTGKPKVTFSANYYQTANQL
jgi:hypothetical protein